MSRKHGAPPRCSEAELPAVTAPEIIRVRGAAGQRGLELRDGADAFEHQLRTELLAPTRTVTKEVPTFSAYATEFMDTYVIANNKRSERSMKACILKHHLVPVFGDMPLDAIKMHPIEVLKASLLAKGLSRKRVNNILPVSAKCCATRTKSN